MCVLTQTGCVFRSGWGGRVAVAGAQRPADHKPAPWRPSRALPGSFPVSPARTVSACARPGPFGVRCQADCVLGCTGSGDVLLGVDGKSTVGR